MIYAVYKDFATGKHMVGEIRVTKETEKRLYVERSPASKFAGQFDKTYDGFYVKATTPEIAVEHFRASLHERIKQKEMELMKAEQDLANFEQDIKERT